MLMFLLIADVYIVGTRRVSYIIYLTDPDDPWQAEDGGSLELYPLYESSTTTPSNNVSKTNPSIKNMKASKKIVEVSKNRIQGYN